MPLLGKAALAMWWDMAPAMQAQFQDWHTHEHFPERLSVPGFLRASRYASADGGEGFFIMYEVRDFDVLVSPAYLAHLNSPTPWSTQLMPHHRNMVRSQCVVVASEGGGAAGHAVTVRLADGEGVADRLRGLSQRAGLSGVHLLQAQRPAIAGTTEQKIRGNADRIADWVVVICGYDLGAMVDAAERQFGGGDGVLVGKYAMALTMTAAEIGK